MNRDLDLLLDVLDMIEAIQRHRPADEAAFRADEVLQAAVLHWIQTIGEAAGKVSNELREAHPEVAWREIVDMRNLVAHGYREVKLEIVWEVVDRDIPLLETQIHPIVRELS